MKRISLVLILAAVFLAFASNAFALSFSADVPFQFTFTESHLNSDKNAKAKEATTSDVNGAILTATAGWFGVGYERYEVNTEGKSGGTQSFDIRMTFQFYDVLLDLPLPLLNIALGYGVGTVNTQLGGAPASQLPKIEEADASQMFLRLGIPLGKVLDLHIGYHVIDADPAKFPNQNGTDSFLTDGTTLTAGVRLGW